MRMRVRVRALSTTPPSHPPPPSPSSKTCCQGRATPPCNSAWGACSGECTPAACSPLSWPPWAAAACAVATLMSSGHASGQRSVRVPCPPSGSCVWSREGTGNSVRLCTRSHVDVYFLSLCVFFSFPAAFWFHFPSAALLLRLFSAVSFAFIPHTHTHPFTFFSLSHTHSLPLFFF